MLAISDTTNISHSVCGCFLNVIISGVMSASFCQSYSPWVKILLKLLELLVVKLTLGHPAIRMFTCCLITG